MIDTIILHGQGTTESLKVAGKPPGQGSSLRFKMTEALLKDCTESEPFNRVLQNKYDFFFYLFKLGIYYRVTTTVTYWDDRTTLRPNLYLSCIYFVKSLHMIKRYFLPKWIPTILLDFFFPLILTLYIFNNCMPLLLDTWISFGINKVLLGLTPPI